MCFHAVASRLLALKSQSLMRGRVGNGNLRLINPKSIHFFLSTPEKHVKELLSQNCEVRD